MDNLPCFGVSQYAYLALKQGPPEVAAGTGAPPERGILIRVGYRVIWGYLGIMEKEMDTTS